MKNKLTHKIISLILLSSVCSCGGNDSTVDSANDIKSTKNVSYVPDKLDSGGVCNPIKLNNNSKVLLGCFTADGNTVHAIWSEKDGLKILPGQMPTVYAANPSNLKLTLEPINFSDDEKVLFILLNLDGPFSAEYTSPGITYLHDGKEYLSLPGSLGAISPNGEFIAGFEESGLVVYKNLKKLESPDLSGYGDLYDIRGINNSGVAIGSILYSDPERSYSNNLAVVFSKDQVKVLPAPVRPDVAATSGSAINSSGDVLINVYEQIDASPVDSLSGFFSSRSYIVSKDGTFNQVSDASETYSNMAEFLSKDQSTIYTNFPTYDQTTINDSSLNFTYETYIYTKDKGKVSAKDAFELNEGEAFVDVRIGQINDKRECLIWVDTPEGPKVKVAKLKEN